LNSTNFNRQLSLSSKNWVHFDFSRGTQRIPRLCQLFWDLWWSCNPDDDELSS